MTITPAFASMNEMRNMVEAVLARSSTERKRIITSMSAAVRRIAAQGVPKRALVRARAHGRRPSRLMAMGEREAESIPALPVVA